MTNTYAAIMKQAGGLWSQVRRGLGQRNAKACWPLKVNGSRPLTDVVPLALFLATQAPIGTTAQSFSLMRRDT